MSKQSWMKWLSGIALVFAGLDFASGVYDFLNGDSISSVVITLFLLAIIAVMISFGKDKAKKK